MFRVGQRVVCVDDRFPEEVWQACDEVPVKGRIYTVRNYLMMRHWKTKISGPSIRLMEIINPDPSPVGTVEAGFSTERFRALTPAESRRERESARKEQVAPAEQELVQV